MKQLRKRILFPVVIVLGMAACSDDPAAPEEESASFSRMIGGVTNNDGLVDATVTSSGLRVVSGTFSGVIHATGSADSLVAPSNADLYVAAFESDGGLAWMRRYGGSGLEKPFAVGRDASDNLFITGTYTGDTNFEGTNLTGEGMLVAKLDAAGNPQWAVGGGSSGFDAGADVAGAQDGGAFVCGVAELPFQLAGLTVGETDHDGFLVRLSSLGGGVWTETAGGSSDAGCRALVRASDGSVYVTGEYLGGDLTIAGTTFSSAGDFDGFIAHFNDAGGDLSAIRIGGDGAALPRGIALLDGETVVAGYMSGTVDFDMLTAAGSETSAGASDVFVARYRANGTLAWVRRFGGVDVEFLWDVCRIGANDILVAGQFDSSITFGSTTLTTNGDRDIFMLQLHGDGSVASAAKVGSAVEDFFPSVASAGESAILVGATGGETRFPDGTVRTGFGGADNFIFQR